MRATERRQHLVERVRTKRVIKSVELQKEFCVSHITILRDL